MTRSVMSNLNQVIYKSQVTHHAKLVMASIFLMLLGSQLYGQQVSNNGDFRVANTAGCAPFTVTPEVLFPVTSEPVLYYYDNTLNPNNCNVDFNQNPGSCVDATALVSDPQFTFTEPGVYYLVQIIGTNPTPRVDYIEIRVFEDLAPFVGVSICSDNKALFIFDFEGDFYDFYNVDFGDGNTMQFPKTGSNRILHSYDQPGTYSMTAEGQLNSGDNTSCVLIKSEIITTFTQIPDPIIDSLIIDSEIQSTLYYQTLNDRLVYNLEIDYGSGFEFFQSISPQSNPNSYLIRSVNLDHRNESYRFRIEATDNCGSPSIFSEPIPSIAFNYNLTSFNNGIEVGLDWKISTIGFNMLDYYLGSTFNQSFNTTTNTTGFTVTFDNCTDFNSIFMEHIFNGKLSRSIVLIPFEAQNLDLPAPPTPIGGLNGSGVLLNFVPPEFSVTEYIVLRSDENGVFQQIATTTANNYTDTAVPTGIAQACYIIQYLDECGNISERSQVVCIAVSGLIRVPTAFSPNGDGINDVFSVGDGIFVSFEMLIYNRWGALVFRSTSPSQGWQGSFDGLPSPIGTYTYKITFKNADNVPISKSGTFVLIR